MGTKRASPSRSGRGRLAAMARHLIDEATAQFRKTGEPDDLHAALQKYGTLVLGAPEVWQRLEQWRALLLLAIEWPELRSDPDVRRARRGLSGIGKALVPPRRPGPPLHHVTSETAAEIAQRHRALVAAIESFRRACGSHGASLGQKRLWWKGLSPHEAAALLAHSGFPPELAEMLTRSRPRQLLPGGGEARRLAIDLVRAVWLDLAPGRLPLSESDVRRALRIGPKR